MKLVIQIPCYNEEEFLGTVLSSLPKQINGVTAVETLVIDDGSRDRTSEIAAQHGVTRIVRNRRHQGLARTFSTGICTALEMGADIIVNLDGDNQYEADDIPTLIEPILSGNAEIVIGARPIDSIKEFSPLKKWLQKLGGKVVRMISKTDVADPPSGFRAILRSAAMELNIFNDYTYSIEMIIQAGQKGMAIASVPIRVRKGPGRKSRLIKNIPSYIHLCTLIMARTLMTYRSFTFFAAPGMISSALGFLLGLRFLYFFFTGDGGGHIQSLILCAILLLSGFFLITVALLADLISINRQLLEKIHNKLS